MIHACLQGLWRLWAAAFLCTLLPVEQKEKTVEAVSTVHTPY